jgi:hypothetical protein
MADFDETGRVRDRTASKPTNKFSHGGPISPPKKTFVFPSNVESEEQFVLFSISKKYKFRREQIEEGDKYAQIALPLPANLSTAYAATYSNQNLGAIGDKAGKAAPDNLAELEKFFNAPSIKGGASAFKKIGQNLAGDADITELARELAGYYAPELAVAASATVFGGLNPALGVGAGVLTDQIVKGTMAGGGIARNPYLAAVFEGVGFKNHTFSYQLTPKSAKESETIARIISSFRNALLPSKAKYTHYYDYPQQVDIKFWHDKFLFDIKPSVLTQFDVNYHNKGPYYHDVNGDKAPVEVSITMNFLESTVRLSDDEEDKSFAVHPPGDTGLGTTDLFT